MNSYQAHVLMGVIGHEEYGYVTHEMSLDAGEPQMEGEQIVIAVHDEEIWEDHEVVLSEDHHDAMKESIDALQKLLKAYNSLMPGAKHIAIQDYQLLNEAPIMAQSVIRKYKLGKSDD